MPKENYPSSETPSSEIFPEPDSIEILPPETFPLIAEFLDFSSLIKGRLINRFWYQILSFEIWRKNYSKFSYFQFILFCSAAVDDLKVKEILEYISFSDLLVSDSSGMTALRIASKNQSQRFLDILYKRILILLGNKTDTSTLVEWIAICNHVLSKNIFLAAAYGNLELVIELLNHVDINSQTYDGETLLHVACEFNHLRMVKYLIDKEATMINQNGSYDGSSPLHRAVTYGYIDVAKILLEAGAQVNLSNRDETTSLEIAAQRGNKDLVSLLIEYGAAPAAGNDHTAFHTLAEQITDIETKKILESHATILKGERSLQSQSPVKRSRYFPFFKTRQVAATRQFKSAQDIDAEHFRNYVITTAQGKTELTIQQQKSFWNLKITRDIMRAERNSTTTPALTFHN